LSPIDAAAVPVAFLTAWVALLTAGNARTDETALVMHLETAILIGVTLSLLVYLHRTSRPQMRTFVPDPRHAKRRMGPMAAGLAECPQIKIMTVEGSIYFGAVSHVGQHFDTLRSVSPAQKHLLVMAKSINFVDAAGAELIAHESAVRRAAGGRLYLYSLREPAREVLERGGYLDEIGRNSLFTSKDEAISKIFAILDRDVCRRCRARIFLECKALPPPEPPVGS